MKTVTPGNFNNELTVLIIQKTSVAGLAEIWDLSLLVDDHILHTGLLRVCHTHHNLCVPSGGGMSHVDTSQISQHVDQ